MNKILNSLIKNDKIQKKNLKTIFSIVLFAFVIWKNEKFKIIVDLKRINIKLYFDAYLLSKQNIIFFKKIRKFFCSWI